MTRLITADAGKTSGADFLNRVLGPRIEPQPIDWNAVETRRKHICAEREAWFEAMKNGAPPETFPEWLARKDARLVDAEVKPLSNGWYRSEAA